MDCTALLHELTPHAERLLHRHLASSKPWYPHELVPWELGKHREEGPWDPDDFPLPDAVRSSLFVNILTEDNLPYYFSTINRMFGTHGPWREWTHRWTAEEGRHSTALRDYLTVTRAVDPVELEDARMQQVTGGQVPEPDNAIDGFVYVALQELATRIAHRNTGVALKELGGDHPAANAGYEVMARIASDENFHHLMYRDLTAAALEIEPSLVVCAIERQVREFEMPGVGIPDFKRHAERIARAGLYNLAQHHDQILVPVVLRTWKVESLDDLTPDAEQARERLVGQIGRIGRLARRIADRAKERVGEAREKVAALSDRAVDRASALTDRAADRASALSDRASELAADLTTDLSSRSKFA